MFDARVFSTLWAVALLFHYVKAGDMWSSTPATSLLIILCSAALMCRPASIRLLAGIAILQLSDAAWKLLVLENIQVSWFFTALISAVLLGAIRRGGARWPEHAGAALQAALLVLYFYAVLHKLNTGYFSPENVTPDRFMRHAPIIGEVYRELGLRPYAAEISVGVEAMIFVALLLPALRRVGVVLSFLLHGALGYIGFTQFFLIFPMLLAFLPLEASQTPTAADLPKAARWVLLALALLLAPVLAGLNTDIPGFRLLRRGLWVVACLPVVVILLRGLYLPRLPPPLPRPAALLLPGALAVWCFFPYLGLAMHPCAAMYSHLSAHSGQSNHLLIPASLQLDALHDGLVEITASSRSRYPVGARVSQRGLRRELVRRRAQGVTATLTYRHGAESITITDSVLPDESVWDRLPMIRYNFPTRRSDFISVDVPAEPKPAGPLGSARRAGAAVNLAPIAAGLRLPPARSPETP
ncbi:MAG: hypothetical protein ACI8RZ_006961 [Myxococcota bacterium]|jgi:hypothetical protein